MQESGPGFAKGTEQGELACSAMLFSVNACMSLDLDNNMSSLLALDFYPRRNHCSGVPAVGGPLPAPPAGLAQASSVQPDVGGVSAPEPQSEPSGQGFLSSWLGWGSQPKVSACWRVIGSADELCIIGHLANEALDSNCSSSLCHFTSCLSASRWRPPCF